MSDFATLQEVMDLWRPLTAAEQARVSALLPYASDYMRQAAREHGKDLDQMIQDGTTMATTAKIIVTELIRRYINSVQDDAAPMSQMTESALGYSMTGTYLVAGGGWFLKENEKKMLGIVKQSAGVVDLA